MDKKTKKTIKIMRELAREQVSVGQMKPKVVPMKKKALLDKIARREAREE